jgi:acetyltransferase-like isoleucine patch superfamily enzyme
VKALAKRTLGLLAVIVVAPVYLSYLLRRVLFGDHAFRGSSQSLSLLPGLPGDLLRAAFYRLTLLRLGRDVQIAFGTIFSTCAASIGDNVYVGSHCVIGDVDIGSDVLLGSSVHLLSGRAQHGTSDPLTPIRLQARHFARIQIGADTWIGNQATIMANIGKKCIIGAGSVVVSDIPDYSVAVGNPARVIRTRDSNQVDVKDR